ncbi:hypothetical protein DY468_21075 [Rhodopseudomonas sp. BR0M22]|nr:hypothetical protein [Rhodopseudomonas sp. BR0M22]
MVKGAPRSAAAPDRCVIAGLDPAIHQSKVRATRAMDPRVKPADDFVFAVTPQLQSTWPNNYAASIRRIVARMERSAIRVL